MNRKLKRSRAIEYAILCWAAILILLIGPAGILDGVRTVAGNQTTAGWTEAVGADDRIQQVFLADGGYLKSISIFAENDLSRKVVNFSVSNDLGETLFSRNVALDAYSAPGFFTIPVEFQTEAGRAYVWQISHPEEELTLGWQNTGESGLTVYGNYYLVKEGGTQEQIGKNILMRFTYADPFSLPAKAALTAGIALLAGFFVLFTEKMAGRGQKSREVRVQWLFRAVGNPLIAAGTAAGLAAVLIFDYYGGVRADKMVYCAGILILAALLFYAVNAKRDDIRPLTLTVRENLLDKGMDTLQTVFWAGALWGCIDYMNAMYNMQQAYAYRKVLIFLGLVLLSMCEKKALFSVWNLIWTVISAAAGVFYWLQYRGVPEQDRLAQQNAVLFVIAGLVLIQLVLIFVRKKVEWRRLSPVYCGLLAGFLALLILFRNTRGWPVYLAAAFGLLYLFFLAWERRERFCAVFCNGIILNFVCALIFAMARRPFRTWYFYRYNFVFHTVTVTACYLTLVLAALLVRLLMRYHRSHKLYAWWGTGLLFGMAASLLILTLSRTGYLAAGVMGLVIWLFVSLFCYRERAGAFFAKTGILILIVLAAFPVTYSAVRLIPPLYDDPYLFELEAEPAEWAIHKGDRADSENYITFPRFAYCFDGKIFGDEHRVLREFVDTFMAQADTPAVVSEAADASGTGGAKEAAPAGTRTAAPAVKEAFALTASADETAGNPAETAQADGAQTSEETAQAAGQADAGASSGPVEEEEGGDISNGRFALFQKYIAQWNLTGHELMGVPLEDGSLSVHAHNTYLQVIHDHGLITGAVFVLLGAATLVQMLRYAYYHLYRLRRRQEKRDEYAALPLAVFVAFAAAGLVEWLFHPCNPMGFAVMAALAPLLIFKRKEK